MTIEYTNTVDDLLAFSRFHFWSSSEVRRSIRVQRLGGAACLMGFFGGLAITGSAPFFIGVGLSTSLVWWLWVPLVLAHDYDRQIAASYESQGSAESESHHRLSVTPEHLEELHAQGESRVRWGAVRRVVGTGNRVYICLSAASAFIIPRDRVRSGDLEEFVAVVREAAADAAC